MAPFVQTAHFLEESAPLSYFRLTRLGVFSPLLGLIITAIGIQSQRLFYVRERTFYILTPETDSSTEKSS
jgi:hypothetical protein